MSLQPIAELPLERRFRTESGRAGRLVALSPSSATVVYDAGPTVRSFTDRWGEQHRFTTAGRSKPMTIARSTMVEALP
jgi:hypothetical protein